MGRWPLSRKILCLALLNLALLAVVIFAFARAQFRFGAESLLLGPAQDRIMAIANSFSVALEGMPQAAQAGIFADYRKRYDADFYLVDPGGMALAGSFTAFPVEVLDRMRRRGPERPPRKEDPQKERSLRPPPRDPRKGPPPERKQDPRPGTPPTRRSLDPQPPVFLVISHNPTAYWAGARVPISLPGIEAGKPAILLMRSASIFNSQVFLDLRLWLGLACSLIVVSVLCWLPFIQGLTNAIGRIDRVTEQIAEGHFDARAPVDRGDELGHLGGQINRMGSRLQSFVTSQKRFLGDIAHELCAPIARIQFALGILEQKAEEGQRKHVAVLYDEVQEMSALVNELLSFSKASLHQESLPLALVDVAAAVQRAVTREAFAGAQFQTEVAPGLAVMANEAFLVRALSNVLRNAIRYAGEKGPITVSARGDGDYVEITVADCGPGLPEAELQQIFAPFYRPEESRTRETGGAGLGLAIVKTCIEACGGTVVCRNRLPTGLEVRFRLRGA